MQVDHRDVALFIKINQVGAALGVVTVVVINALFVKNAGVWLVLPFLSFLMLCLHLAGRSVQAGDLFRSLLIVAVGNWTIAVAIPFLMPFLWPIMTLTVLMPLVLASSHLSRRHVMQAILATAIVAGIVASIGLINDDGGVIDDIDDSFELALVVGSLAAQIIPIGMIAWLHNERQRGNVTDLTRLNEELRQSEGELAASRDRVVRAADAERRRIERDLHDGAQQRLVALGVRLRLLESQGHEDEQVRDGISTVLVELDHAIQDVRELAHGIYPPLLQARGLAAALAAVVRRSPLQVQSDLGDIARLPEPAETAMYFVALEALGNATKHAPDATVNMSLSETGNGHISLTIADDGPGFDPTTTPSAHGFNNMRDRLAVVGGELQINATPGGGTTVTASLPSVSSLAP